MCRNICAGAIATFLLASRFQPGQAYFFLILRFTGITILSWIPLRLLSCPALQEAYTASRSREVARNVASLSYRKLRLEISYRSYRNLRLDILISKAELP